MKTTLLENFKFIGITEGVCGNEPIIIGTLIKPLQATSFGTTYEACLEFDLSIEQVLECYRFVGKKAVINAYLDDLRDCPKGFVLAKNIKELKQLFEQYDVSILSLDHDLGVDENDNLLETGYDFVKFFCEYGLHCDKVYLHTDNTPGRENMFATFQSSKKRGFISDKIEIFPYPLFPNKYSGF